MAEKLKPITKIPTIPRPASALPRALLKSIPSTSTVNLNSIGNTVQKSIPSTSTVNLNSIGNTVQKSTKLPPVRPSRLRRSKSVTDLRTTRKRPALTEFNPLPNKITKLSKPEPAKIAQRPKIPPYDYKARFNNLKEKHDKLIISHQELRIQHETTAEQNTHFLSENTHILNNFNSVQKSHEELKKIHYKLQEQQNSSDLVINNLQTKSDELENELKNKTELLERTADELSKIKEDHGIIKSKLSTTLEQLEETLKLDAFMKEELLVLQDEKRKLHNKIQELKGNIRVFCRIRPPLSNEQDKLLYNVNYLDETSIEIYQTKDKKCEYSFDQVFGPTSTQGDIFEELSQLVQSALDGYNVCVFAYGQTGSGKTYTMEGENQFAEHGMIPRSIDTIFKTLENMKRLGWTYKIKASFLEIYNENIVDLLNPKNSNLDIRMSDAKGSDLYVPNLTIEDIGSADKLKSLMKIAQRNRAVAATENNERSSRSHSVTKINLEGIQEEQGQKCIGNLNLIDLAGSEKFHTNETTRLRETTNINKSLSNLSNVILSLVQKNSHIPYRNSKLTHLLMPALGGNSKTLMLVNISPLDDCYNESINSLRFASTVNRCKTGTIKKQKSQT